MILVFSVWYKCFVIIFRILQCQSRKLCFISLQGIWNDDISSIGKSSCHNVDSVSSHSDIIDIIIHIIYNSCLCFLSNSLYNCLRRYVGQFYLILLFKLFSLLWLKSILFYWNLFKNFNIYWRPFFLWKLTKSLTYWYTFLIIFINQCILCIKIIWIIFLC